MTFSNTKQKLQKIYNQSVNNSNTLLDDKNKNVILNFFKQSLSGVKSIHDTGWLTVSPKSDTIKTIRKNHKLPEMIKTDYSFDIELPDFIMPYLDVKLMIVPPPDSDLGVYDSYTTENYYGDWSIIKVNGTTLYDYNTVNIPSEYIFSDSRIAEMGTPSANTKQVWNGSAIVDGDYVGGRVNGARYAEGDIQNGTFFNIKPYDENGHEFTGFTSNSFTGIGDEVIIVNYVRTENFNVTRTYDFNSSGGYVFLGTTQCDNSETTDRDFIYQGRHIYYAPNSLDTIRLELASGNDRQLFNLPTSNIGSITYDRNPSGYPTTVSEQDNVYSQNGSDKIRKDLALFKISDGTDFPLYRIKTKINATIMSPAIIDDPNPSIKVQEDVYTYGTRYTRTTNDVSYKSLAYVTAKQDVQYRILFSIKNPLFYQEVRKYDTTQ